MLKNFAKLIDVKSIVTLVLTAVFAVLSLTDKISPEQFQTVFTVVISFISVLSTRKENQNEK